MSLPECQCLSAAPRMTLLVCSTSRRLLRGQCAPPTPQVCCAGIAYVEMRSCFCFVSVRVCRCLPVTDCIPLLAFHCLHAAAYAPSFGAPGFDLNLARVDQTWAVQRLAVDYIAWLPALMAVAVPDMVQASSRPMSGTGSLNPSPASAAAPPDLPASTEQGDCWGGRSVPLSFISLGIVFALLIHVAWSPALGCTHLHARSFFHFKSEISVSDGGEAAAVAACSPASSTPTSSPAHRFRLPRQN